MKSLYASSNFLLNILYWEVPKCSSSCSPSFCGRGSSAAEGDLTSQNSWPSRPGNRWASRNFIVSSLHHNRAFVLWLISNRLFNFAKKNFHLSPDDLSCDVCFSKGPYTFQAVFLKFSSVAFSHSRYLQHFIKCTTHSHDSQNTLLIWRCKLSLLIIEALKTVALWRQLPTL